MQVVFKGQLLLIAIPCLKRGFPPSMVSGSYQQFPVICYEDCELHLYLELSLIDPQLGLKDFIEENSQ